MALLQLCRRDSALPESICGLAVSREYIATVRSTGIVEIFSNPYLFKVCSIDAGMRDIQSAEFDGDVLVIGSLSEGVSYVDMNTFAIRRNKKEGFWMVRIKNKDRMTIYSLTEGGSELYVNDELVYRSIGYMITGCFGQERDSYLVGTYTGRFLHIQKGKVSLDLPLSTNNKNAPITDISCVVGSEYAVSTMEGEMYIIDVSDGAIKQIVSVRKSSINGICTIGDRIFMIGADSRLICYAKTSRYYAKECQNDFHVSDALFIKEAEGSIVTASEDGTINICNIPKIGRPAAIKRYQDMPCAYSNGKMYTVSGCEMRIYEVSENKEESRLIFKHITKDPVVSIDSTGDTCVIRTKEGIRAYEYDWNSSTVSVKKEVKGLILYHAIVEGRVWYIVSRKKLFIGVSDIESSTETEWALDGIGVDYVPSHISKGEDGTVIISGSDVVIFDFNNTKYSKITDKDIKYFMTAQSGKEIYCAGQARTIEIKERSILSVFSGGIKIEDKNLTFRMPVIDIKGNSRSVFPILQHQVKIFEKDAPKKKAIIGPVIDGVQITKEGVVAMQRPWAFTRQRLPLQVLKEKYGRK